MKMESFHKFSESVSHYVAHKLNEVAAKFNIYGHKLSWNIFFFHFLKTYGGWVQ